MESITLIIILLAVGLLLMLLEVLIPGGIVGLFGFGFIIGASVVAYGAYGTVAALLIGFCSVFLGLAVLVGGMKWLPRTQLGKRFINTEANTSDSNPVPDKTAVIVGKPGIVVTPLVPVGQVLIEGCTYEARSDSGYLSNAERITAVRWDDFQLVVRKAED